MKMSDNLSLSLHEFSLMSPEQRKAKIEEFVKAVGNLDDIKKKEKDARNKINTKLSEIESLLSECVNIAEENNVYFQFNPTNTYGVGMTYYPGEGTTTSWGDRVNWLSSSQSC